MPNGDWVVNEMAKTTPEDFHWGLMPLPADEKDGERFVGSMTEQIWIPAQAANPDDAKKFFSIYENATPAFGAFGAYNTNNLPDFDVKATLFGQIDDLATGKISKEDYQKSLSEAWKTLAANPLETK